MDLKLQEIEQFIRFLADTDIAEVEIKNKKKKQSLRIVRARPPAPAPVPVSAPIAFAPPPSVSEGHALMLRPGSQVSVVTPSVTASPPGDPVRVTKETTVAITAPMVGTFYKAASRDAAPFVRLGDMVKKGQVVCIIEAMKLMNEIESEVSGRVVSIVKENATPVEYGEEMFLVEPV
ncbi:MAG: acetyl-CoA carboxylase biotin carboxyl carrier protein [Magnetococcus sp. YQC-5]